MKILKYLLIASALIFAGFNSDASQKQIVVAVIDTGIDLTLLKSTTICKTGHQDFTGIGLQDNHGHGTHISGLIDQYAKNFTLQKVSDTDKLEKISANYCQIIIKFFDPKFRGDTIKTVVKSFRWAIDQKVDVINYSGGGIEPSDEEREVVTEALDKGIKVIVAAGNESSDLSKQGYYPALYDKRIIVVGNLLSAKSTSKSPSSNYGKEVNAWEPGTSLLSRGYGHTLKTMSGTSQATAVKTGKIVHNMLQQK